jgi:5-methylcytosine-specific restriction endonuclease McrA
MGQFSNRTRMQRRIQLWKRDRLPDGSRICYICGCPVTKRKFTLDHIDPACLSRNHDKDNLALCCFDCNQAKGHMSLEDYLKTIPSLILRVARLKYKPASYAVLMKQRGIRIAIYRFFSP